MFNRKLSKIREELFNSFGNFKDDSFDIDTIKGYFSKKNNTDAFQILSDKAIADLDFNELFTFVDRTNSKIGQQYLYNQLRTIPADSATLKADEDLISEFTQNSDLRTNCQLQLSQLNESEAYYIASLFQDEHKKEPKWFFIVRLLSITSVLSLLMALYIPRAIFLTLGVFVINIGVHYWNKKNLFEYVGSIPQLLKLNNVARELFKNESLKKLNPSLLDSIKIIDKVRNRMLFFKLEVKLEADHQALFWGMLELLKIMFLLEPLLLFGVLKQLDTKRKEIEAVFNYVGKIDALISIASLRKGLNSYCIPTIIENQKTISAAGIYHPLILDCVENSINLSGKSILLTGSNMSGKTSFIRTIGLNAICGLTINTCFASQLSMPKTRIYSAIRISDDLMNDKSYYFEEVLTIKEMIDRCEDSKPNLFLLDELFKGTNTIERISAGKAVLSSISKSENIVFVSTHDIELADLLKDEFDLYHFSEKVNSKTVDFDYKLKSGKLKTRNAIKILEINNYPQSVINEAVEIASEFDKTNSTRM